MFLENKSYESGSSRDSYQRITAKTSGRRSTAANIKPARFIGYRRILGAHKAEHFFLLLVKSNPGKFLFPCWFDSLHMFFTFSLLGCYSLLETGFLLLPIFHRSSRLADILYTDSGNVACDMNLFRAFLGVIVKVSKHLLSAPFM